MKPKSQSRIREVKPTIGLLANGAAGSWHVDVDETCDGPQRWFLQLDGPWYVYVEIPKLDVVQKMLEFLKQHLAPRDAASALSSPATAPDEFEVGKRDRNSISLLWDVEHGDRCFLLVKGPKEFCTRLSLAGDDLRDVMTALQQVGDELDKDGVLAKAC
jgi:hypothetical protein